MALKKQLFERKKLDWQVQILGTLSKCFYTKKDALLWIQKFSHPGDKVQIFKLSYEFKDAWVVGDKPKKARGK